MTGTAGSGAGGAAAYELSARAPDRQAVASWFTQGPTGGPPTIPESVGRIEPPEWSRSLPGQFQFAAADDFDEFSGRATAQPSSPVVGREVSGPAAAPGEAAAAIRGQPAEAGFAPGSSKTQRSGGPRRHKNVLLVR